MGMCVASWPHVGSRDLVRPDQEDSFGRRGEYQKKPQKDEPPGQLVRGRADLEDILDRLSKGVNVVYIRPRD